MKHISSLKSALLSLIMLVGSIGNFVQAQVPTYITPGGSSNNNFPFNSASNKVQWVYTPAEFTPTLPGGTITHVYLRTANSQSTTKSFDSLRISIKHVSFATFATAAFETGLTTCYGPQNTTIAIPANGWFGVQLTTPFVYDGVSNLIIEATITNLNGMTANQNSTNGTKRVWGARWGTTASSGTGQAACGLEVLTCLTNITTQPQNTTVCQGNNASFNIAATNANTYQWQLSTNGGANWGNISNGGGYNGVTTNTLTITGATVSMNSYQYRCMAINNTTLPCTVNSNAGILTVSQPPAILTTTPGTACPGTPAQVGATATTGATVQWYSMSVGGTLLGTGNVLNIASAPGSNTTYYAFPVVSGGICPATTRTGVVLTVNAPPVITLQPLNKIICNGDNTSFTMDATGASGYQWEVSTNGGSAWSNVSNGGVYSGTTGKTLTINGAPSSLNTYQYRCKASCVSSATSNAAILTVNTSPAVTTGPADVTICAGQNTSFSCSASGSGTLNYQWQLSINGGLNWIPVVNGGIYGNAATSTLNITNAPASINNYQYRCMVTGICPPSATSSAAIISINTSPAITTQPTAQTGCPGAGATFSTQASGSDITYQWQEFITAWNNISDGGNYSGTNTNAISITGLTPAMDGRKYRCVVSGICTPDVITTDAVLNMGAVPVINTTSNSPVCEGQPLQLNSGTSTGVTHSWAGPLSYTSTNPDPVISSPVMASAGNYVLTATLTSSGCSIKDTVTTTVKVTPSVPLITGNSPVCTDYNIILNAMSTQGAVYSWTGPTGFSSSIQNPTRTGAILQMTGYYKVEATIDGCISASDSVLITVIPSPEVGAYPSPGSEVCSGDTIRFFGMSANTGIDPIYQWMKNGLPVAGANTLKYVDAALTTGDVIYLSMTPGAGVSCNSNVMSTHMPITVRSYLAPKVAVSIKPATPVWQDLLVTFTATATDAGENPKYQWKLNGQPVPGATNKTWAATTFKNNDIVVCEVTSNYECPQPTTGTSNEVALRVLTGLTDITNEKDISLYPNPNKGSFTVKGKMNGNKVKLEILNTIGQLIYKEEVSIPNGELQQEIQPGNMINGIYLLRITRADEQYSIRFRVEN